MLEEKNKINTIVSTVLEVEGGIHPGQSFGEYGA